MKVEPVSAYPSASSRTLAQWLDEGYAAQTGPQAATRLREIADARALLRGMWAAFASLGTSAVLVGFLLWAVFGRPAPAWAVGGAVLAAFSVVMMRSGARWIPRSGGALRGRGPGSLRGGVLASVGILVLLNAFLVPSALVTGNPRAVISTDVGLTLLLVSVLVVPGAVASRARTALRRDIARDPRLAEALERERLAWAPRPDMPMFGPL